MNAAVNDLLNNTTLIAALVSWILAQFIKFGLSLMLEGRVDLERLTGSGGMPSGHAALVSALTVRIAVDKGMYSSEFAMSFVLALIVMYDAAGVRQAVGVQAQIINDLLHDIYHGSGIAPVKIKEILGHTPVEVIAGSLLGIVVAILI